MMQGGSKRLRLSTHKAPRRGRWRALRCRSVPEKLRIVFVGTEVAPWSKVGGLADVMSALPIAFAAKGHEVMSVAPRYGFYPDVRDTGLVVPLRGRVGEGREGERAMKQARLHLCQSDGVDRIFVEHPTLTRHDTTPDPHRNPSSIIYPYAQPAAIHAPFLIWKDGLDASNMAATSGGLDLGQECERFGERRQLKEWNGIVFVCNDWPCGLLPFWIQYYKTHGLCCVSEGTERGRQEFQKSSPVLSALLADHEELKESFPMQQRIRSSALAVIPDSQDSTLFQDEPSVRSGVRNGRSEMGMHLSCSSVEAWDEVLDQSVTVFLIHSMAFTGPMLRASLQRLDLEQELSPYLPATRDGSWLEMGLSESDSVVTVSPGYAQELQSQFIASDSALLQRLEVTGIMNGIDTDIWTPYKDPFLSPTLHYGHTDVPQGKARAKAHLQHKLGMERGRDVPVFGFIGRLDHQKGVDILLNALLRFYTSPENPVQAQFVILGCGDATLERHLNALQYWFPGKAVGITRFDDTLAHEILAGSDFLLMPSRFEPCGLVALSALRYGTIPIAPAVGGLKEIVQGCPYTSASAEILPTVDRHGLPPLGLRVESEFSSEQTLHKDACALHSAILQAMELYGTSDFRKLQRRCMFADVSWDRSVLQWKSHLASLIQGIP